MHRTLLSSALIALLATPVFAADSVSQLTVEAVVVQNGSIPRGAQRVSMLNLRFAATCEKDVTVSTVTLAHEGLGDPADLISIYALKNNLRVTRGHQMNSSTHTVTLRFSNFTIPKCSSASITVAADYSSSAAAGGEHRLILDSAQDVDAGDADVTSTITVSPQIARTVGYSEGNIDVTYLSLPRVIRYGRNRIVARFRLEADRIDDHLIHAITFTNEGTASNGDLQNLFVQSSRGQKISSKAIQLDGDAVTLRFNPPLLLSKNETKVLELHADVFGSRKRSIGFEIMEPSDIEATVKRGRN